MLAKAYEICMNTFKSNFTVTCRTEKNCGEGVGHEKNESETENKREGVGAR